VGASESEATLQTNGVFRRDLTVQVEGATLLVTGQLGRGSGRVTGVSPGQSAPADAPDLGLPESVEDRQLVMGEGEGAWLAAYSALHHQLYVLSAYGDDEVLLNVWDGAAWDKLVLSSPLGRPLAMVYRLESHALFVVDVVGEGQEDEGIEPAVRLLRIDLRDGDVATVEDDLIAFVPDHMGLYNDTALGFLLVASRNGEGTDLAHLGFNRLGALEVRGKAQREAIATGHGAATTVGDSILVEEGTGFGPEHVPASAYSLAPGHANLFPVF